MMSPELAVLCGQRTPNTLGAAANQDQIIALRPSDLMLLEGDPRTSALVEVLSGTLQARLIFRRYAAAIIRRTSGIHHLG